MSLSEIKNNTTQSEKDVTLYLGDFLRGIRKFWWVGIVLGVVLGMVLLYVGYATFTPQYQVTATFTVHTEKNTLANDAYAFYYNRSTANQLATVFPHALQSSMLQEKVCRELGVSRMPAQVSVSCITGTNVITLTTTGKEPKAAYDVLLSVIDNYSHVTEYIIGPTRLVSLVAPQMPEEPSNRLVWYELVLEGMVIGLAIGAAWIALYAVLRRTVRTKEDIHQELNQTCVGVLPQVTFKRYLHNVNTDVLLTNPLLGKEFPESYRILRDAVQNSLKQDEKVVLLTSTAQGEGKSVTTLNLAMMLAKNYARVLVIDGDIRNSGIAKILGPERAGSRERRRTDEQELYHIDSYEQLGVSILTFDAETRKLWQVMRANKLRQIIEPMREQFDLILIDTPPCGIISDAAIFAGAADVAFYIIRQDAVLSSRIREGINTLLSTDVRFVGCILNGAVAGASGYGNSYGYGAYRSYYGYGHSGKYAGKYRSTKREK